MHEAQYLMSTERMENMTRSQMKLNNEVLKCPPTGDPK